jgi:hypothetical protein
MWKHPWMILLTAGVVVELSACAALEETRKHGAHFASWDHMEYSLWRAPPEKITPEDVMTSRQEKWWGERELILVEPIQ